MNLSDSNFQSRPCGARESEASDHKVVSHKYVQLTEIDDENENNFGYLKFISNFADADRIPQRPGRGLTQGGERNRHFRKRLLDAHS